MISARDVTGLIVGFALTFAMLAAIERLGRRWPPFLTRKLAHVGAGMMIWGMLALFDHWYVGVLPFASSIVINYALERRGALRSIHGEGSALGTVYFSISVTALFSLLWRPMEPGDRAPIAAAAVMAMTWGDAAAALVGRRWGPLEYTALGERRSVEGSIAMLFTSFAAIAVALAVVPGSALSPTSASLDALDVLLFAATAAFVAAAAEAISPRGTDNLSVPFSVAATLALLTELA